MNPTMNPSPPDTDSGRHHRTHLAYLLAVVAAMAALLWLLTAEDPWEPPWSARTRVQIDDRFYLVPERRLERLAGTRPNWLTEAEGKALDRFRDGLEREVDELFARVHGRVPDFAEWYYSVPGAGMRLLAAIPNPFWPDRAAFLTDAVAERLFPDDTWQAELDEMERAVGALYAREFSGLERRWLAWLARELAPYRRDEALPGDLVTVDLDTRLRARLAGVLEGDHIDLQMATGLGAGALLARGAIARVNAGAASARAAARLAGRGTAATGAATCGAAGPLALGCAVAVFTGVTLGTEWALLKADEALHRGDLEAALHGGVDALRVNMMDEYGRAFVQLFESNAQTLDRGIRDSLRPIDRVRPEAGIPGSPRPPNE